MNIVGYDNHTTHKKLIYLLVHNLILPFNIMVSIKDEWTTNLHLPKDLYERNICIYKNQLLFLRRHDMRAYLFNAGKNSWTELKSQLTSDQKNNPYPETCILFCKDDTVYLKGILKTSYYNKIYIKICY